MYPARVPADRGTGWLGDGWRIFRASPGLWILLVLVWGLITIALNMVPLVGALVYYLVSPALAAGLLLCARDVVRGAAPDLGRLFDPLTNPATRTPILVLGALFLVANLVALFLAFAVTAGGIGWGMHGTGMLQWHGHGPGMTGPDGAMPPQGMMLGMGLGLLFGFATAVAFSLLTWILFFYAIPLAIFDGIEPAAAIGLSVRGILRNWLPLLLLSLVWFVLSIVATIPLMLGWLILMPLTFGAWYASYAEIFGRSGTRHPGDGAPEEPSGATPAGPAGPAGDPTLPPGR